MYTKVFASLSAGVSLFALIWILALYMAASREPDLVVVIDKFGQRFVSGRGPFLSQAHWWRDVATAFWRPVLLLLVSSLVSWFMWKRLNQAHQDKQARS
jgi:hypothetical protein